MKHPMELHSPTKQSCQSAGILRHSPDHPRILKLPVYRPIERPDPKYPLPKGRFREALEEDALHGGFIDAESLGGTSCSVLHAESTGEDPESLLETSPECGNSFTTSRELGWTFGEELPIPDTSEEATYKIWSKVFGHKNRRERVLKIAKVVDGPAQPPAPAIVQQEAPLYIQPISEPVASPFDLVPSNSVESGAQAAETLGMIDRRCKEGSSLANHENSMQSGFAWNLGCMDPRPTTRTCGLIDAGCQPCVENRKQVSEATHHRPVTTLQEDVEMTEDCCDWPCVLSPHLQGPDLTNLMEIDPVEIIPAIATGCNEVNPFTGDCLLDTWIQSKEQQLSGFGWIGGYPFSALATWPHKPILVDSQIYCSDMEVDLAEDVEMGIEERPRNIQQGSSTFQPPGPAWNMVVTPQVSEDNQILQTPLANIACKQNQRAVSLTSGLQTSLIEPSLLCPPVENLPLIRLEPASPVYPQGALEQYYLPPVLGYLPSSVALDYPCDGGGNWIPPDRSMATLAPLSLQLPESGILSPVNAKPTNPLDDLPALSFTPSTTGQFNSTGPSYLNLPTPLTSTGPDVSLFPSPGAVPGGSANRIPEIDPEAFLNEAIKGGPVVSQHSGTTVGLDIGFVNLSGDDFIPYEDVGGEEDEDDEDWSGEEGWEEVIGTISLDLSLHGAPLVPSIAGAREELVITLNLEAEENG